MIEKYGRATGGSRSSTGERDGTPVQGRFVIREDVVGDMHGEVKAHHVIDIPKVKTTIRDVGFSLDGEYMVMVGEGSVMVVCKKGP